MLVVILGDLLFDVIVWLCELLAIGVDVEVATQATLGGQAVNVAAWVSELGERSWCVVCRGDDVVGIVLAGKLDHRDVELVDPTKKTNDIIISIITPNDERTMTSNRNTATL